MSESFAEFWRLIRGAPRLAHKGLCGVVTEGWRVALLVEQPPDNPAGWQTFVTPEGGSA